MSSSLPEYNTSTREGCHHACYHNEYENVLTPLAGRRIIVMLSVSLGDPSPVPEWSQCLVLGHCYPLLH